MSPDNTSDGWLKKKWEIIEGKRCLIKGGSGATQQEPYNEVLASRIMDRLSIPHVSYTLLIHEDYPYSVCEDFITPQTDLVPAWYIMQTSKKPNHISAYQHYLNCCKALGILGIEDSLDRMIVLDYLIANEDRHQNNFGALRNAETLEWLDLNVLNNIDEELRELIGKSVFIDTVRCNALCSALCRRVEMMTEVVNSRPRMFSADNVLTDVEENVAYSGESASGNISNLPE